MRCREADLADARALSVTVGTDRSVVGAPSDHQEEVDRAKAEAARRKDATVAVEVTERPAERSAMPAASAAAQRFATVLPDAPASCDRAQRPRARRADRDRVQRGSRGNRDRRRAIAADRNHPLVIYTHFGWAETEHGVLLRSTAVVNH